MIAISNLLPVVAWTLLGGVVLTAGDILLREWLKSHFAYGFWAAFVVYGLGVLCMMMSFLRGQHIAVATIAAVIVNAVGYILVAHVLYGDSLRVWQVVGIVLGIVAFTILELA